MPTAKKLPSGSYRVRCYIGTDSSGKKITKSFTAPTKKEAEFLATQFLLEDTRSTTDFTFSQALNKYIDDRSSVLSPATLRDYKNRAKNDYNEIAKRRLNDLKEADIQKVVNNYAKNHAPKSTRNFSSLITSTFKAFRPNYALNLTLPQKVKTDPSLPTEDDIKKLLEHYRENDYDMFIAVQLAVFAPLRRSEISALESTDIVGNVIHVNKAMVKNDNNDWVIKTTKTVAGDRFVELPGFLIDVLTAQEGRVVKISPDNITSRFGRTLKRLGIPKVKFHSLRHYSASFQHAIGIPDAYIMARGGWNTDTVLKQVYRHALSEEQKKTNNLVNSSIETTFAISCHESCHDSEEKPIN